MCPFQPADRRTPVAFRGSGKALVTGRTGQCRGFRFGVGRQIRCVGFLGVQVPASTGSAARSARASSSPCSAARSNHSRACSISNSPARLREI